MLSLKCRQHCNDIQNDGSVDNSCQNLRGSAILKHGLISLSKYKFLNFQERQLCQHSFCLPPEKRTSKRKEFASLGGDSFYILEKTPFRRGWVCKLEGTSTLFYKKWQKIYYVTFGVRIHPTESPELKD